MDLGQYESEQEAQSLILDLWELTTGKPFDRCDVEWVARNSFGPEGLSKIHQRIIDWLKKYGGE